MIGKINVPVKLVAQTAGNWEQLSGPHVFLRVSLDRKSCSFTPSKDGVYVIVRGAERFEVQVGNVTPPTPDPEVPPTPEQPPTGTVIDLGTSFNGPVRTLTKHGEIDKQDPRLEARAGSNRKITIGNGKMIISGDQVRCYFLVPHYNAQLDYDRTFEGKGNTDDDGSDDLRSRHNEGEIASEKFNKIGGIITSEELGGAGTCKRENVHGTYSTIGKYKAPKVTNGQKHHVTYIVKDEGAKQIRIIKKIDGKEVCNFLDKGAPDTFFDKATIKRKSYFRIRNNGKGSTIVENPKLTILGD